MDVDRPGACGGIQSETARSAKRIADSDRTACIVSAVNDDRARTARTCGGLDRDVGTRIQGGIDVGIRNRSGRCGRIKNPAPYQGACHAAVCDRDIRRVEQPLPLRAPRTRTGIHADANCIQNTLAGCFDEATIAAACSAFGCDSSIDPRGVIGPDDDPATVAAVACTGPEHGIFAEIGCLRVAHIRVFALIVAPYTDAAPSLLARHVDQGPIYDAHAIAQHIDLSAFDAGSQYASVPLDVGVFGGP